MKKLFGATFSGLMLTAGAVAGSEIFVPPPEVGSDGDATGAIVLLLMLGAVILLNNGTTTRNTQQTGAEQDANDDDVIMKF